MRAGLVLLLLGTLAVSQSTAPAAPGPADAPAPSNRHWIGVRDVGDGFELFDRRTGALFVPRGANLLMKVREGSGVASGLFRPGDWKPKQIRRELSQMADRGYNTVRVFIDLCRADCISAKKGSIRPAYAKNVAVSSGWRASVVSS